MAIFSTMILLSSGIDKSGFSVVDVHNCDLLITEFIEKSNPVFQKLLTSSDYVQLHKYPDTDLYRITFKVKFHVHFPHSVYCFGTNKLECQCLDIQVHGLSVVKIVFIQIRTYPRTDNRGNLKLLCWLKSCNVKTDEGSQSHHSKFNISPYGSCSIILTKRLSGAYFLKL